MTWAGKMPDLDGRRKYKDELCIDGVWTKKTAIGPNKEKRPAVVDVWTCPEKWGSDHKPIFHVVTQDGEKPKEKHIEEIKSRIRALDEEDPEADNEKQDTDADQEEPKEKKGKETGTAETNNEKQDQPKRTCEIEFKTKSARTTRA